MNRVKSFVNAANVKSKETKIVKDLVPEEEARRSAEAVKDGEAEKDVVEAKKEILKEATIRENGIVSVKHAEVQRQPVRLQAQQLLQRRRLQQRQLQQLPQRLQAQHLHQQHLPQLVLP